MYGLLSSWLMKMLLVTKIQSETRAKVTSLLKKFKNYNYIKMTCLYLDILEKIVPASKVFEGERLLPFEVKASIQTTTGLPASFNKKIPGHIQDFSIFWSLFEGAFIIFQDSSKW